LAIQESQGGSKGLIALSVELDAVRTPGYPANPMPEVLETSSMQRLLYGLVAWLGIMGVALAGGNATREAVTVTSAAVVFNEFSDLGEQSIPESLLANAEGLVIFPDMFKAAISFGGRSGRGILLVRDEKGQWSRPVFLHLSGGSWGWQLGLQRSDLILVFKTREGVDSLLARSKLTLGTDAGIAVGPLGRHVEAATDPGLKSEILSYSRSRGLFLGASFEGSVLYADSRANDSYYGGSRLTAEQIIRGEVPATPGQVDDLLQVVNEHTARLASLGQPAPLK
jgi:lipid-binding SYLF domain-containing protein